MLLCKCSCPLPVTKEPVCEAVDDEDTDFNSTALRVMNFHHHLIPSQPQKL